MSIQVCAEIKKDTMDMRDAYCSSLIRLADGDERIIALDADLMGAMGTKPFEKKYPERTVDCGIQEANMVGVACEMCIRDRRPDACG